MLKIVAISDVHARWNKIKIPECDILISTGDYSFKGEKHIVKAYHEWLDEQDARYVISIQGNHELWVESNFNEAKAIAEKACPGVFFLEEGEVVIEGVKIWCSSITPFFFDWAYNRARDINEAQFRQIKEIKPHWDAISNDVEILATHGPPYMILDELVHVSGEPKGQFVGCVKLSERIRELKQLKHHIFGHIHYWGGQTVVKDGIMYHNASICDEMYAPTNPITVIEYEKD